MEILIKKTLEIVLNEGGGAVSILLIINIWLIWKMNKRFKSIEDSVDKLKELLKQEISDIELALVKKYVEWGEFNKLRDKVEDTKNELSKVLGKLNGNN